MVHHVMSDAGITGDWIGVGSILKVRGLGGFVTMAHANFEPRPLIITGDRSVNETLRRAVTTIWQEKNPQVIKIRLKVRKSW